MSSKFIIYFKRDTWYLRAIVTMSASCKMDASYTWVAGLFISSFNGAFVRFTARHKPEDDRETHDAADHDRSPIHCYGSDRRDGWNTKNNTKEADPDATNNVEWNTQLAQAEWTPGHITTYPNETTQQWQTVGDIDRNDSSAHDSLPIDFWPETLYISIRLALCRESIHKSW